MPYVRAVRPDTGFDDVATLGVITDRTWQGEQLGGELRCDFRSLDTGRQRNPLRLLLPALPLLAELQVGAVAATLEDHRRFRIRIITEDGVALVAFDQQLLELDRKS